MGRPIRSTIPRGRITARHVSLSPDFIVADHRDIPGPNYVALIDPGSAVPGRRRSAARRRADPAGRATRTSTSWSTSHKRVTIDYQQTAPNYDVETSDVCFKKIAIDKGEIDRGFRNADVGDRR